MNDDAKRRLVGGIILAAILVVIAVLISDGEQPEEPPPSTLQLQLDAARDAGERNESVQTQTLNLEMPPPREAEGNDSTSVSVPPEEPSTPAGSSQSSALQQSNTTVSKAPPPSEPARPASPIPRPAPQPEPAAKPATTQTASSPPPAADGDWAVQVGSFSSPDNAQRLRSDLVKKGYPAFVRQAVVNGTSVNRVRVGPFRTEVGAQQLAARLSAELGQPVKVLRDR